MQCLTLRVETGGGQPDWRALRGIATSRPPQIPGLRARLLRPRPRALVAQYLFDRPAELARFRAAPAEHDPAVADLLKDGPVSDRSDALPAAVANDLFDRPVFILSAPRAGSTLLYDLLAQCDSMWSLDGEMQYIIDAIPTLNLANRGYRSQMLDASDADPDTMALVRCCLMAAMRSSTGESLLSRALPDWPDNIRLLEKTPENALRVPFLRRIFPNARFIYLYRDLRQNVASIMQAWKHPGFVAIPELPAWPGRQWCFLLPDGWRDFRDKSLCHIAAYQWDAANRAIVNALDAIEPEHWTTVTYANLIADPAGEIHRLCEFIGVEVGARLNATLARPLVLSPTTITPPSPIKWKQDADFDPAVVKPLQPLAGRMRELRVNPAPPVGRAHDQTTARFACFVDRLRPANAPGDVVVAPSLRATAGGGVPLGLLRQLRHRERFLADHPMLWIEDCATGVWTPLWLRREQAWLCTRLKPGQPPPAALTGRLYQQLVAAGALTTPEAMVNRASHGAELCESATQDLPELRYCLLPQLFDLVLVSAVAAYYSQLIKTGEWALGDAQVERRHGWHNERITQFLHHQLIGFVSRVAGRPLKPTYSYTSAYQGGARLDAHTDREQCDYTLSVMIDETPSADASSWPLWFETPQGKRSVLLAIGDGVLFRGCELPHWRGAASAEHTQINLLFHFVPSEWAGVMD